MRNETQPTKTTENQILHLEFQTQPQSNPPIPLRMLDYSVRLKRLYRCSGLQIVIFWQETTNQIVFTQEYQDETTIHHLSISVLKEAFRLSRQINHGKVGAWLLEKFQ